MSKMASQPVAVSRVCEAARPQSRGPHSHPLSAPLPYPEARPLPILLHLSGHHASQLVPPLPPVPFLSSLPAPPHTHHSAQGDLSKCKLD